MIKETIENVLIERGIEGGNVTMHEGLIRITFPLPSKPNNKYWFFVTPGNFPSKVAELILEDEKGEYHPAWSSNDLFCNSLMGLIDTGLRYALPS